MRHVGRSLGLILALLVHVGSAPSLDAGTVEGWDAQLLESTRLLHAGEHAPALKIIDHVVTEMEDKLGPGDPATKAFARVLAQKALAHAGLGQSDDALWYWDVAVGLFPDLRYSRLAEFGPAGQFLDQPRDAVRPQSVETAPGAVDAGPPAAEDVTPPRARKQRKIRYPDGAKEFHSTGLLIVEVILTKDGRVQSPRILQPLPAPTMTYTALEAVKGWEFEPATQGGQPIEVVFKFTVNYKLK